MNNLTVFRLTPIPASDPRWDITVSHGVTFVRAATAGEAREIAAAAELKALGGDANTTRGASVKRASAFSDELAYELTEDHSGQFDKRGPEEVLLVCGAPLGSCKVTGPIKR